MWSKQFILLVLGLNEAHSIYSCTLCHIHKDERYTKFTTGINKKYYRWDMSKPESDCTVKLKTTLESLKEGSTAKGKSKLGSLNPPLLKVPIDHACSDG